MSDLLLRRRQMMVGGSPTPPTIPEGALPNPFSVSANQQVYFSKGNLQWSATGGGITPTTHATADGLGADGTWRFAESQLDYVGDQSYGTVYGVGGDMTIKCNNLLSADTYQGWQDVFQWGTSGYDGKVPYWTGNYVTGLNISGTNYDWGVYNAISNGGNTPNLWRVLTKDEWVYLLNTRSTTSGIRYAKANVNGLNGLIVVPDNWDSTLYTLNSTNDGTATFATNTISANDWNNILEVAGCVFLFAGGNRDDARMSGLGSSIYYPSATYIGSGYYSLVGNNTSLTPNNTAWSYPRYGTLVRLVH